MSELLVVCRVGHSARRASILAGTEVRDALPVGVISISCLRTCREQVLSRLWSQLQYLTELAGGKGEV